MKSYDRTLLTYNNYEEYYSNYILFTDDVLMFLV